MEKFEEFLKMIKSVGEKVDNVKDIDDTLKFIFEKYKEFSEENYDKIQNIYGKIEKVIEAKAFQEGEILSADGFKLFTELPVFTLDNINIGNLKISASELHKNPRTFILNQYGVLSSNSHEKITLGYPFYIKQNGYKKVVPRTFSESISNLAWLLDTLDIKRKYLKHVQESRGDEVSQIDDALLRYELDQSGEELTIIYEAALEVAKVCGELFQFLGSHEDFYENLHRFYVPSSKKVYVHSTTSGLVIPREYEGSETAEKSSYRTKYFDFLKKSRIKIYYQLDPFTTMRGLANSRDGKEASKRHFASFLQIPNIEISAVDFDNAGWKRYYTLVSPGCGVAFSTRDRTLKKEISQGFIANFWTKENYLAKRVEELYRDDQEKEIVKAVGKRLTQKEARELSEEVIEKWNEELYKRL